MRGNIFKKKLTNSISTVLLLAFVLINFSILVNYPDIYKNFSYAYRKVRETEYGKVSEIKTLITEAEKSSSKKEKEKIVNEIEDLIFDVHDSFTEKTVDKYENLKKKVKKGEATVKDVFEFFYSTSALPASKEIKGGAAWELEDGSFMNADEHNKEVIKGLEELAQGNYEYFNKRRDGSEELDKDKFMEVVGIYNSLKSDFENREVLWVTTALHDYGKLLMGDHYTGGVKLVSDILNKLDFKDDKINFISNLIYNHANPGMISLGEVPPKKLMHYIEENNIEKKDKFLKMLIVLNVVDVNAVGEGKFSNQYLTERLYFSNSDNLKKLGEVFNEVRLSGLRGEPLVKLDSEGNINVEEVKSKISDKILKSYKEKITFSEKKNFFNDFMKNMSFDYATFLIRNMEEENVMKWMYLNASVAESTDGNIEMIRNSSDKVAGELDKLLNNLSFSQIRNKFKNALKLKDTLKKGKTAKIFGIPMWLENNGRLLVIDTDSLSD